MTLMHVLGFITGAAIVVTLLAIFVGRRLRQNSVLLELREENLRVAMRYYVNRTGHHGVLAARANVSESKIRAFLWREGGNYPNAEEFGRIIQVIKENK